MGAEGSVRRCQPLEILPPLEPSGPDALAAQVASQAGRGEGKPFSLGNGHDGAGIGGGIDLELEGWIGFHLGEKSSELGL
jgi:hypothetical protein